MKKNSQVKSYRQFLRIFIRVVYDTMYYVTIVAIEHGLLKKFWPLVKACVLGTAGSSFIWNYTDPLTLPLFRGIEPLCHLSSPTPSMSAACCSKLRQFYHSFSFMLDVRCIEKAGTESSVPETFKWNKVNCEFWLDFTENLTEYRVK